MKEFLNNQIINSFLWIPFLLAFGASAYFNFGFEPNILLSIPVCILLAFICFIKRVPLIIKIICIFSFGFFYASSFTNIIATPQLKNKFLNTEIFATVKNIDYTDDKTRIYLSLDASTLNPKYSGKANIRVSTKLNTTKIKIGDNIKAKVGIFRPSGAYAPETFDYARWAYFNSLSATGFLDSYEIISNKEINWINSLRNELHLKTNSFLADSLVLGYKNAVPKQDTPIWTATGIGHVWSISGFHMTLVSGWLILLFYSIFRTIPFITKRVPARIPATIFAWAGLLFYLYLSGLDVATIRAFLMTSLLFVAFLFGRTAFSMRNVAIAFCIIFFMNPHYVMQPGFQLSFSAIFGLVWLWTEVKPKLPKNKILKVIYTATLTSLVATVFTAPFVISHFYSLPIYGLLGNLLLLPIFSFAIMPLVIIGTFTACFNFNLPLTFADKIYYFTLDIAKHIADLPFANLTFPHIPNIAVLFITLGFMCLMFIKPLKIKFINLYAFLFFNIIGIIIVYFRPTAVFYATPDHELVAFRKPDGLLEFNKSRASNHYFAFNTWKQLNNEETETPNKRRKHNKGVYLYETKNFNLVYIQKFMPLQKNIQKICNDPNIDYIVSYFKIDAPNCNHKILRNGFIIYESGKVRHYDSNRRWHKSH